MSYIPVAVPIGVASGGTGATSPATARVSLGLSTANVSLQWTGGAVVANGTYYFTLSAPYAGTISSYDYLTGVGTFVIDIFIAGVSVNGTGTNTVSSATSTNVLGTSLNTFTAGQVISLVVTGATTSPTNAIVSLRLTKT